MCEYMELFDNLIIQRVLYVEVIFKKCYSGLSSVFTPYYRICMELGVRFELGTSNT